MTNPDHSSLADIACWQAVARAGARRQQLAMEMLDASQQASVMSVQGPALAEDAALQERLQWSPPVGDWDLYGLLRALGAYKPAAYAGGQSGNTDADARPLLLRPAPLAAVYDVQARIS